VPKFTFNFARLIFSVLYRVESQNCMQDNDDVDQQQMHQQQQQAYHHHHQQSNESLDNDLRLESKAATELIDSSILLLLRERWEQLRIYRIKIHVALLLIAAPQAILWAFLPPSPDWTLSRLFMFAITSVFVNGALLAACQLATYNQRIHVDILLTLGYASTVIFNCIYCITSISLDSDSLGYTLRMDERTVLLMCLYIYVYPMEVGIPYRMQSIAFPILTLSMFFAMSPRKLPLLINNDKGAFIFEITALAVITSVFSVITFLPQRFVYYLERSQKILLQTLAIESRAQIVLLKRVIPDVFFDQLFTPAKMAISEPIQNVTVLFCEVMVTSYDSAGVAKKPEKLGSNLKSSSLTLLSAVFGTLERVVEQYGIFKVETIFSEFMAVSGLPAKRMHHKNTAYAMVVAALEMIREVRREFGKSGPSAYLAEGLLVDLQIGINTGPVVEGILGRKLLPRWKLFGDTVNTSSRMKSTGIFGRVNLSRATRNHIMTDALAIAKSALGFEIFHVGDNSLNTNSGISKVNASGNAAGLLRQLSIECEAAAKSKRDHVYNRKPGEERSCDNENNDKDDEAEVSEPISNLDILFGRCVGFFLRQRPPMIIKGKGMRCPYLVELCVTDALSPSMERLRKKAIIGLLPHSSFRTEVQTLSKIDELSSGHEHEHDHDLNSEKEVLEDNAELLAELRDVTALLISETVKAERSESLGHESSVLLYPPLSYQIDPLSNLSPDARRWFSMHDEVWAKHGLQQILNGMFRSTICPFLWDGEGSLLSSVTTSPKQKRRAWKMRPSASLDSEKNEPHSLSQIHNGDDTFDSIDASILSSSIQPTPRYAEELLSATILAAQQIHNENQQQHDHKMRHKLRLHRHMVRDRDKRRNPPSSLTVIIDQEKEGEVSLGQVNENLNIVASSPKTMIPAVNTSKRLSRSFHRLAVSAGGTSRGARPLSRLLESPLATVQEDTPLSSPANLKENGDRFINTHLTAGDDNVAVPMLDPWSLSFTREQADLEDVFVAEHIDRFSRKSLILVFLLLAFIQINSHFLLQRFYGSTVAFALTGLSVLSVSGLLLSILFFMPQTKDNMPQTKGSEAPSWMSVNSQGGRVDSYSLEKSFGLTLSFYQKTYARTVIFVLAVLILSISLILAKVSDIPSFEYRMIYTSHNLVITNSSSSGDTVESSFGLNHEYSALYVISCFQLVLLAPFYFGVIFKHHTLLVIGAQVLCVPFIIIFGADEGTSGAIWLAIMLLSSVRSVWKVELRLRGTFLDKLLVAEHKLRTKQMLLAMLPYSIAEEMMRRSGLEVHDEDNDASSLTASIVCKQLKRRYAMNILILSENVSSIVRSCAVVLYNTIGRWIWMNMFGFEFQPTNEKSDVDKRQSLQADGTSTQTSFGNSTSTKKIQLKRGSRVMPEPNIARTTQPLPKPTSSNLPLVSGATIEVSLLMIDLVGFTSLSADVGPSVIVELLDELYSSFDRIIARRGARKIETIGDAMLVSCGAPEATPPSESAPKIAKCALDMLSAVQAFSHRFEDRLCGHPLHARVGIHTGKVLGGVIGSQLPRYQLFGSAVDEVQLMESTSEPGKVRASPQILAFLTALVVEDKIASGHENEKNNTNNDNMIKGGIFSACCYRQSRLNQTASIPLSKDSLQRAVPDMKCVRILPDGSGFIERDRAGGLKSGAQW